MYLALVDKQEKGAELLRLVENAINYTLLIFMPQVRLRGFWNPTGCSTAGENG